MYQAKSNRSLPTESIVPPVRIKPTRGNTPICITPSAFNIIELRQNADDGVRRSFDLEIGGLDHFAPLVRLALDIAGELRGIAWYRAEKIGLKELLAEL